MEKNKKKKKKKKKETLRKQKGLPMKSEDLNNNNSKEGTAESVKGQRAVAPLTLNILDPRILHVEHWLVVCTKDVAVQRDCNIDTVFSQLCFFSTTQ